jgi:UDP-glucose:(heptosyl)LPS alpha-1,3-glucosyltransferase
VVWETARHLSVRHPVSLLSTDVDVDGLGAVSVTLVDAPTRSTTLRPMQWRAAARRGLASLSADVVVSYGVECPVGDVLVVQSVHRAWLERGSAVPVRGRQAPAGLRRLLPRHRVLLALEASYFCAARDRRIVAVSQNVVDDLQRLYALRDDQLTVVPNGYDPAQCSAERSASLRDEMRAALGLRDHELTILLVANEWHRKGLAVLLEAIARQRDQDIQLLLVGRTGPGAYTGQIDRLGLHRQVHYCGPTDDVARFHAAADVFVMPTQYEAFGSVIVEALASGLPVITTASAGAAVAVQHDVNGLLQRDPHDADELEQLLARAGDPHVRERWRRAAPASVRGYAWSAVMERFESEVTAVSEAR